MDRHREDVRKEGGSRKIWVVVEVDVKAGFEEVSAILDLDSM